MSPRSIMIVVILAVLRLLQNLKADNIVQNRFLDVMLRNLLSQPLFRSGKITATLRN